MASVPLSNKVSNCLQCMVAFNFRHLPQFYQRHSCWQTVSTVKERSRHINLVGILQNTQPQVTYLNLWMLPPRQHIFEPICISCLTSWSALVTDFIFVNASKAPQLPGGGMDSDFFPLLTYIYSFRLRKLHIFPPCSSCVLFSSRPQCGKHVLRLFWGWHHNHPAKWLWDPETHQTTWAGCRKLCKFGVISIQAACHLC